ncbi:hypothetical protein QCM77_30265 [Bradyrhizobium sp. SSUT18]|uniref:hypothetical protein n=1 Tax=Bradyrhizobium sp. SSUT18 TaxID=3040602 RepID=UPI0024492961|nr:hypothetical protein [Bradyrhizobium sp. SSUT18]MDH2404205.1 hypothetical protein [Bradyrhizobium sp. SSUT18]
MIKDFFSARFVSFAKELDVRLGDDRSTAISTTTNARGSEGPRGLAAYNYAFLHTAREFGSSVFCPLVIDAPNQQGQDAQHLPAIIAFLVKRRPSGAQLILGVEEAVGIEADDARIVNIGERRNQLLSAAQFETVSNHLSAYSATTWMRRLSQVGGSPSRMVACALSEHFLKWSTAQYPVTYTPCLFHT